MLSNTFWLKRKGRDNLDLQLKLNCLRPTKNLSADVLQSHPFPDIASRLGNFHTPVHSEWENWVCFRDRNWGDLPKKPTREANFATSQSPKAQTNFCTPHMLLAQHVFTLRETNPRYQWVIRPGILVHLSNKILFNFPVALLVSLVALMLNISMRKFRSKHWNKRTNHIWKF